MKDGDLAFVNVDGFPPLRKVNVLDSNGRCRPHGNRSTVSVCVLGGDFDVFRDLERRNGLHADHHVPAQRTGGPALESRLVHGHVLSLFGALQWNPRIHQRAVVGEAAPDQKGHGILRPVVGNVRDFLGEFPVAIDGVLGHVRPQIRPRRNPRRMGRSNVANLDQGTRLGVALAKEEKIVRERPVGQDHQVALHKPRAHPVGGSGKGSHPDLLAKGPGHLQSLVQSGGTVPVQVAARSETSDRASHRASARGTSAGIALVATLRAGAFLAGGRVRGNKGLMDVPNVDLVAIAIAIGVAIGVGVAFGVVVCLLRLQTARGSDFDPSHRSLEIL
mmetsp:Transcript_11487/g.33069  ORF Transcript_11487/g.33069 Transcript_11487/m.33069 type:complete len:332 (-) Transcript_11487:348-1343(-)